MNNGPIKRRNPFDRQIHLPNVDEQEKEAEQEKNISETVQNEVKEEVENTEDEEIVVKQVQKIASKPKQNKKIVYVEQENDNKEKYTATMDSKLRRRIKIACAERGIMFSKFIEDACREKLSREGE